MQNTWIILQLNKKNIKESGQLIDFIIDDTISEKTKPSSKVKSPIKKCLFHNSHLKSKNVYGHQILVSLLACDGLVLSYSVILKMLSNSIVKLFK